MGKWTLYGGRHFWIWANGRITKSCLADGKEACTFEKSSHMQIQLTRLLSLMRTLHQQKCFFFRPLTVFPFKKKKRFSFPFWMQYIALELLYWQLCSVENASVIWTIIFSCRSISCPISSCDSHLMCRILVFYWALVLILSDLLIYVWYFNVLHN